MGLVIVGEEQSRAGQESEGPVVSWWGIIVLTTTTYNKIRHRINDYRSEEKLITQAVALSRIGGGGGGGGLDGLLAVSHRGSRRVLGNLFIGVTVWWGSLVWVIFVSGDFFWAIEDGESSWAAAAVEEMTVHNSLPVCIANRLAKQDGIEQRRNGDLGLFGWPIHRWTCLVSRVS